MREYGTLDAQLQIDVCSLISWSDINTDGILRNVTFNHQKCVELDTSIGYKYHIILEIQVKVHTTSMFAFSITSRDHT